MAAASSPVSSPPRCRPRTWAWEPATSSAASRTSNGRLAVKAIRPSAASASSRPCQRVTTPPPAARAGAVARVRPHLAAGPRLHAQAPQADEAGRVLVVEGVGRVVGGQAVVVEADVAAPADHRAPPGRAPQADVARHVLLALVDEGVDGLLEGREPHAVVDQLGPAGLEAELLVGQVALQGESLQVLVGLDEGEGAGGLVALPALDADPPVLDHVDPAPPVRPDHGADGRDQLVQGHAHAVDRHRHARLEGDDQLGGLGGGGHGHGEDVLRRLAPTGPR